MVKKQNRKPLITTIVLTWNSADFIAKSLESLRVSSYKTRILVVDNASHDGTPELISEQFPQITTLQTGDNYGYAGGNNRGIEYVLKDKTNPTSDYIFILNPDAYVAKDCIEKLVERMETEKDLAAVSPIIYFDDSKKIWFAGSTINWAAGTTTHTGANEIDSGRYNHLKYTGRVNGCAMLIRRTALQNTGLMDENYFLYYEETDWSVRFKEKGYKLGLVPLAHVWHQASASTGGGISFTYQYYMTRNRLYFIKKFTKRSVAHILAKQVITSMIEAIMLTKKQGIINTAKMLSAQKKGSIDFIKSNFGRRED